jgi:hypothetical protein
LSLELNHHEGLLYFSRFHWLSFDRRQSCQQHLAQQILGDETKNEAI